MRNSSTFSSTSRCRWGSSAVPCLVFSLYAKVLLGNAAALYLFSLAPKKTGFMAPQKEIPDHVKNGKRLGLAMVPCRELTEWRALPRMHTPIIAN